MVPKSFEIKIYMKTSTRSKSIKKTTDVRYEIWVNTFNEPVIEVKSLKEAHEYKEKYIEVHQYPSHFEKYIKIVKCSIVREWLNN